jgi:Flp pilus assembly pilin Flp
MLRKDFFRKEDGVISAEYVIFVAAIAILLAVGVSVLFNAMSNYFATWAGFFAGGS